MHIRFIKQYSLYKKITPRNTRRYSLFKFGHVPSIKRISREMVHLISRTFSKKEMRNSIIYATNKSPVDDSCKKSSFILAENIARSLRIPILIGEYTHIFSDIKFYRNHKSFRKTSIKISPQKNKVGHHNQLVIMIDDSFVTGKSLKDSLNAILKITKKVAFFSIVRLDPNKQLELDLNDYILKNKSSNIIKKIVAGRNYRFTTQMLRTINDLKPTELRDLVKKISSQKRRELEKGYRNFFNRPFGTRI